MAKSRKQETARDKKVPFEKLRRIIKTPDVKIHFVGVGGVSMYSLATLARLAGASVSGSDRYISERAHRLVAAGARIIAGHSSENVEGADLVVYSHAIHEDNPELVRAGELSIPTVSRAEYLGAVMKDYKGRIGVSGTHGKSTTTAMLDAIFTAAMTEPTTLAGASLPMGEPLRIGGDGLLIYEACEYKDSFLKFSPTIAIALNLELDHTDYFRSIDEVRESFRRAMSHAERAAIINLDDEHLSEIVHGIKAPVITFGQGERADYRYLIVSYDNDGYTFELSRHGALIASFKLKIFGVFNVTNAVAAICAALEYGIDVEIIKKAIEEFCGIPRRLEYLGERYSRPVYYDYAHHPTAVAATVNALKMMTHGAVTVIFKPHTYSRTKTFWEQFRHALSLADHIILTDIYPAREEPIEGISSRRLAWEIGDHAIYCDESEVLSNLDFSTTGAIIIMGAGDMDTVVEDVMHKP